MGLSDLFIDVERVLNCTATPSAVEHCVPEGGYGLFQLLFLMAVYGAIRSSGGPVAPGRRAHLRARARARGLQGTFCSRPPG